MTELHLVDLKSDLCLFLKSWRRNPIVSAVWILVRVTKRLCWGSVSATLNTAGLKHDKGRCYLGPVTHNFIYCSLKSGLLSSFTYIFIQGCVLRECA